MRLVAVALDGNVLGLVEALVGAAAVHALGVLLGRALVASNGDGCQISVYSIISIGACSQNIKHSVRNVCHSLFGLRALAWKL